MCWQARRNKTGSGTTSGVDVGATLGAKLDSGLGTAEGDMVRAKLGSVLGETKSLKR